MCVCVCVRVCANISCKAKFCSPIKGEIEI